MNTTVRRVAIIGGNRIPFARSNTVYSNVSNQEMLTATLQGLVDRFNLHGKRLGDVAAGAVMKHSRDFNLVRECVLSTTLSPETPAYDLQQACGTGLEAIMLVANKIALGHIECGIGGGVDTTSDAPIGINEKMRKILMEANRAKGTMAQLKVMSQIRPAMLLKPAIPKNGEPRTGFSMGEHAELMAREWAIPREEQDQLAVNSHANMARAYKDGFFSDLITPFKGVSKDNNLREGITIEKLRTLKPCFDKKVAPGQGTLTPANSTPLTDGASAVLLGSEEWAKANNLPMLAYITFSEVAAVDFFNKKEGLLMAPAYAVPRMLARAGISLQDFDFYEIHEAFAAQVLCTLKAWEDPKYCKDKLGLDKPLGSIDRSKLNVNGSSLAAGHPFAATGGRIVASLAKMLNQKGSGRGLISICAAGGQGVVAIIER
jgi:acetyl-CoA C-acetyltransferase